MTIKFTNDFGSILESVKKKEPSMRGLCEVLDTAVRIPSTLRPSQMPTTEPDLDPSLVALVQDIETNGRNFMKQLLELEYLKTDLPPQLAITSLQMLLNAFQQRLLHTQISGWSMILFKQLAVQAMRQCLQNSIADFPLKLLEVLSKAVDFCLESGIDDALFCEQGYRAFLFELSQTLNLSFFEHEETVIRLKMAIMTKILTRRQSDSTLRLVCLMNLDKWLSKPNINRWVTLDNKVQHGLLKQWMRFLHDTAESPPSSTLSLDDRLKQILSQHSLHLLGLPFIFDDILQLPNLLESILRLLPQFVSITRNDLALSIRWSAYHFAWRFVFSQFNAEKVYRLFYGKAPADLDLSGLWEHHATQASSKHPWTTEQRISFSVDLYAFTYKHAHKSTMVGLCLQLVRAAYAHYMDTHQLVPCSLRCIS